MRIASAITNLGTYRADLYDDVCAANHRHETTEESQTKTRAVTRVNIGHWHIHIHQNY